MGTWSCHLGMPCRSAIGAGGPYRALLGGDRQAGHVLNTLSSQRPLSRSSHQPGSSRSHPILPMRKLAGGGGDDKGVTPDLQWMQLVPESRSSLPLGLDLWKLGWGSFSGLLRGGKQDPGIRRDRHCLFTQVGTDTCYAPRTHSPRSPCVVLKETSNEQVRGSRCGHFKSKAYKERCAAVRGACISCREAS